MRAEIAAGIIAFSFLLNVPFICRQVYRTHFQRPVEQEQGALEERMGLLEQKTLPKKEAPLEQKVETALAPAPVKTQPRDRVRDAYNAIKHSYGLYPSPGIQFVFKDNTEVIFKYDRIAAKFMCKYIDLVQVDSDEKMYLMCLEADKNKDRIISRREAEVFYNASLSGQR